MGHTHTSGAWNINECWKTDGDKREHKIQIGVRCGHYMEYGGYVEKRPYKPTEPGSMVAYLGAEKKEINVARVGKTLSLI